MIKDIIFSSFLVILGSLFLVINDAVINYLSPKGIKFYHFVFFGSPIYFFFPIYLLIKGTFKENLKSSNYFIPIIRSLIFLPLPFFTFITLKNISLPEYTTLHMSAPIFATIFGIILLKEKINKFLLISIFSGTMGVIFVIQPGFENFNAFYLLVLFSAFLITVNTFLVNKYNYITTPLGFFIYGGIFVHALSIIIFINDPIIISIQTFTLITIASIFINSAMLIMTIAFQRSQKYYSSIFCLVYIQIFFSIIIGYVFFNEYLNFYAILGAIFIVLSGIVSIPAQQKQAKA